jgi:hypothetical protein
MMLWEAPQASIVLSIGGEMIRCAGVVATKHPQVGNGIDFIDMATDDRLKLSRHIAELDVKSQNESGD